MKPHELRELFIEIVSQLNSVNNEIAAELYFHALIGAWLKDVNILRGGSIGSDLRFSVLWIQMSRCLDENTFVKTKNGKKKIKELTNQDEVLSYNFQEHKKEWSPITVFNNGKKECYQLQLENRKNVIATNEHTFFVKERNNIIEKKLCDIKVGDLIACDKKFTSHRKEKKGNIGNQNNDETKNKLRRKANERWNNKEWKEKELLNRKNQHDDYKKRGEKLHYNYQNGILKKRITTKETIKKRSLTHKKNGKPVWNKNLTKEIDERVNKISQTHIKNGKFKGEKNPSYGIPRYPKKIFVEEVGYKVRSSWEKECILTLLKNNIKFEYEKDTFKLNDTTYTPDFKINENLYLEVKGPLFEKSINKYKYFLQLYPHIKLIFLAKDNWSINQLKNDFRYVFHLDNEEWIVFLEDII